MEIPIDLSRIYTSIHDTHAKYDIVNWYPAQDAEGAFSLYPTEGLKPYKNFGDEEIRGLFRYLSDLIVCVGNQIIRVQSTGAEEVLGTIGTQSGRVSMAAYGNEFILVDGLNGWYYNGTTLATIDDTAFPENAEVIEFIDGFYVALESESQRFWVSRPYNGSSWDGLDYASSEFLDDNTVNVIVAKRKMWTLGTLSTEVYYNAGTEFPLQRQAGTELEVGCAAKWSLQYIEDNVLWLGSYLSGGYAVFNRGAPISSPEIEDEIRQYSRIDDAIGMTYKNGGHTFYLLKFPEAKKTWAYDFSTGRWHRRGHLNLNTGEQEAVIYDHHIFMFGKHLVADANGNVYELTHDAPDENGTQIQRRFSFSLPNKSQNMLFIEHLTLDFEVGGTGVASGQFGNNPKCYLDVSTDKGQTWTYGLDNDLGSAGQYRNLVRYYSLGSGTDFRFNLYTSAPIRPKLYGVTLEAEAGQ